MEKETELYLINKIKQFECENAYLKGKGKGYENKENGRLIIADDEIKKALNEMPREDEPTSIFYKVNHDMEQAIAKAKAFDKLQELLHLRIEVDGKARKFYLKSPKHSVSYVIDMEIDQDTNNVLWGCINDSDN